MSFPRYPHNWQGFPNCSFHSYFRTDIPSSHHTRPSADVLYRIAFVLGTSMGALLEKQIMSTNDELTDIPEGLRNFALAERIPEEEIKMLAQIHYRGHRPYTADDWKFLYESIKRSVWSGDQ